MPSTSRKSAGRLPRKQKTAGASISGVTSDFLSFDHQPLTRLVFGAGSSARVGELVAPLGAKKVLLVTDPGIAKVGHAARIRESLEGSGISVTVFDQVRENPTTLDVDACVAVAKTHGIELIVGLGGGSSMDTAKGCNFILTNGGRMQDYWGIGKAGKPMLPFIAIPTTSGTGSECQSFALIADEQTHQKMACGDTKAAARIAILDPLLTLSQPAHVTACTGLDAISHALETAVTRKRNAISSIYSQEAFRLCFQNFSKVLRNPGDEDARGKMLLGAALAGSAIENSMLGAAHSAANPLTSEQGIVHGRAVALMLPHVMRFNAGDAVSGEIYSRLYASLEMPGAKSTGVAAVEKLIAKLETLIRLAGLPSRLRDCGVKKSELKQLAMLAKKQWTAAFNPRPLSENDFMKLYTAAW